MALTKSFSTTTLLASAIAGIVGSGWLLGPMACAKIAGPASILCWGIAGILMMIVAATFVIMTRAQPITGGTVRFFQLTYGHFAGFSFAWIAWLAWVAVSPIETMALIQYSSNYFPALMTQGAAPVLSVLGMGVAMIAMILITAINSYGVKVYGRVNSVILAFKLLIPIITAGLLFTTHFHAQNFVAAGGFMPHGIKSLFSALPLAGVIYSFIGFNPVIQLAAESHNPKKAIPIAIFGALAVCIVLYSLVQAAFIAALPSHSLQHGWSAISFVGDRGPFIGLLTGFGFVWFIKALYVDSCVSPFGTAMVQAMATSRLTYAMSENGYFPKSFMHTNNNGSPKRAMLFNLIIGFAFFLPFPSWQHMVGFLVSCLVLGYVVGPMSLMVSAARDPERFKPFSNTVIQGICITAFYICNLLIFWSGWDVIFKVMLLFGIGYVILAGTRIFNKGQGHFKNLDIIRGSWVVVYMIGLGVISYCSSFGGNHLIPFGIDFIVVGLFSVAVYTLAYIVAARTEAPRSIEHDSTVDRLQTEVG